MIKALAFDLVEDTIETLPFSFSLSLSLSLSQFVMKPVLVILDYIETNYVAKIHRRKRLGPGFSHETSNKNTRVICNLAGTNNDIDD